MWAFWLRRAQCRARLQRRRSFARSDGSIQTANAMFCWLGAADVAPGDLLSLRMADGEVAARATDVKVRVDNGKEEDHL